MSIATLTVALLTVGAGLVAGVFFAFSTFVMKALAQLPPAQGIAAMQRINVVVLNPLFLGLFLGTAVPAAGGALLAFAPWSGAGSMLLLGSSLCYLLGTVGVTMAFNVPRNERLARLAPDSPPAAGYWPKYLREWTRWNHVRTLAAALSCTGAVLVLAM